MKKFFLIIMAFGLFSSIAVAKEDTTHHLSENAFVYDSVDNATKTEILKELRKIRALQDDLRIERREIWTSHLNQSNQISKEDMASEYGAMLQIADNTQQDWLKDDWNSYGLLTIIIAIIAFVVSWFSLVYTKWTYDAQKKTEEHTTNAPVEIQQWKLKDLPRHFYRNLVCTSALILKYKAEGPEKARKRYPSESNLKKLETLPDDIILPIDIDAKKEGDKNPYRYAHELKLLLRNYNVEVEVASGHLSRATISDESLVQDFDNLLYKPISLVKGTFEYERYLPLPSEGGLVARTMMIMLQEHFKKLMIVTNFDLLFKEKAMLSLDLMKGGIDSNFKTAVDYKEGLDRSIDGLLACAFGKDSEQLEGIEYSSNPDNKYEATITKETAKTRIMDLFKEDKDKDNFEQYFNSITSINSPEEFITFYQQIYKGSKNKQELEELYGRINPYLVYLKKDKWEFHTLIKHTLAVDAAIETDRIGMVNFS